MNECGEPNAAEAIAEETGEPKEKFEPDTPVPNDLGDEFVEIGNQAVVQDALEDMDRLEISKMDADALKAYAEVVTSFGYLKDNLEEPERRRNATVEPWGEPDD